MNYDTLINLAQIEPSLVSETIKHEKEVKESEMQIAFTKALSELQAELPEITKNEKIVKMNGAGLVEYEYVTMDKIKQVIKPYLRKHGFAYTFKFTNTDDIIKCSCKLMHVGGHIEECEMSSGKDNSLSDTNDIQKMGSAMTYLMRYTLIAVLGLAVMQDDDATHISKKKDREEIPAPKIKETPTPKKKNKKTELEDNNIFTGGQNDTIENKI